MKTWKMDIQATGSIMVKANSCEEAIEEAKFIAEKKLKKHTLFFKNIEVNKNTIEVYDEKN